MMQNPKLLNDPPPPEALATRTQSGFTMTYIEGWYAIQVANEIFGPGRWTRGFHANGLQKVFEEEKETDKGIRHDIGYICEYFVAVDGETAEDVGYGVGQSYVSKGDAHESAVKEAVTDALKRCLLSSS